MIHRSGNLGLHIAGNNVGLRLLRRRVWGRSGVYLARFLRLRRELTKIMILMLVAATIAFLIPISPPTIALAATNLSIRVHANHLVNQNGQIIRLLGVDRSGTEYECVNSSKVFDGPSNAVSVRAMVDWHINAVRIPLNEDCWLGINGVVTGGETYRVQIERYVRILESFGLYAILDLHWSAPGSYRAQSQWPMADLNHAPTFWKSMAQTFKADHAVIFDLFNEPYITGWSCWRNGCQSSYGLHGSNVFYQTAGMQQLVDAVRSTGATTPLMLGGLAYSSDVAHWRRYEPTDPVHQLIVSFHTYNFGSCNNPACWNSQVAPLAKVIPVVTGEFGENGCTDTYDLTYMPWADQHGVSYLGWAWDSTDDNWSCSRGPALIMNYSGTPTAYGLGLKQHLATLKVQS